MKDNMSITKDNLHNRLSSFKMHNASQIIHKLTHYQIKRMNILRFSSLAIISSIFMLTSCGEKRNPSAEFSRNMYDPIAYNPDQPNENFPDGKTAQLPPHGTIPIGFGGRFKYENTPEGYELAGTQLTNPLVVNQSNLSEGKSLYLSMCSHCHGEQGNGDGAIIAAGKFPAPPSYSKGNSSRGGMMKDLSDGKIYHTIFYGLNLMGSHASQLSPAERWKVVMYVRQLQKL